jgi:hypothetical protein
MTDIAPPPADPPAGLPAFPAPAQPRKRSAAEIASYATIACGLLVVLSLTMPVMHFNSVDDFSTYNMSDTPDAVFFALIGLGIAALGVMRIYRDHPAVRVLTGLTGAYSIWIVLADKGVATQNFLNQYQGYNITMTWGPALIMIASGSALAIAAACVGPKQ